VVRNGYHRSLEAPGSAGAVKVTDPWVNDRRTTRPRAGESGYPPPLVRKTPKGVDRSLTLAEQAR
jgi:hypothetical protein